VSTPRARCPYCERRLASRDKLRLHIGQNECGKVPPDVALAYPKEEQRHTREAAFLKLVVQYAEPRGWRWFHVERGRGRDGRWLTATTGAPGVPDLWLVRGPQLVVIELKAKGGREQPGQADWIAALDQVPGVTAIMGATPADWPAIQMLLA
jgi:hypothetical protein